MAKWQVSKKRGTEKKIPGWRPQLVVCWLAPSGFLLKLLLSRFSISDYRLQFVAREEVGPHFFGHGIPGRLSSVIDFNEKIVYYNLIICNVNEN